MSGSYNVEAVVRDSGIVYDLARLPAPISGGGPIVDEFVEQCALCRATEGDLSIRTAHEPSCPWRRAREACA